jgi:hypothetical protein
MARWEREAPLHLTLAAIERVFQKVSPKHLGHETNLEIAGIHNTEMNEEKDFVTGVVYTKRTQRDVIPAGVDGPLGDMVITSGLIYASKDLSRDPVGKYSVSQLVVALGDETERRDTSIELSFNRKYARKSWISELEPPFKKAKQASEVNLIGVEEFPLGGGRPDRPFTLGIATGTGSFIGAEGTVTVNLVPGIDILEYNFSLV